MLSISAVFSAIMILDYEDLQQLQEATYQIWWRVTFLQDLQVGVMKDNLQLSYRNSDAGLLWLLRSVSWLLQDRKVLVGAVSWRLVICFYVNVPLEVLLVRDHNLGVEWCGSLAKLAVCRCTFSTFSLLFALLFPFHRWIAGNEVMMFCAEFDNLYRSCQIRLTKIVGRYHFVEPPGFHDGLFVTSTRPWLGCWIDQRAYLPRWTSSNNPPWIDMSLLSSQKCRNQPLTMSKFFSEFFVELMRLFGNACIANI